MDMTMTTTISPTTPGAARHADLRSALMHEAFEAHFPLARNRMAVLGLGGAALTGLLLGVMLAFSTHSWAVLPFAFVRNTVVIGGVLFAVLLPVLFWANYRARGVQRCYQTDPTSISSVTDTLVRIRLDGVRLFSVRRAVIRTTSGKQAALVLPDALHARLVAAFPSAPAAAGQRGAARG